MACGEASFLQTRYAVLRKRLGRLRGGEEAVEELEKSLVGISLEEGEIKIAIQEFLRRRGVVLAGVSASDIAEVVYRAASN